jgi:hypothetical protein
MKKKKKKKKKKKNKNNIDKTTTTLTTTNTTSATSTKSNLLPPSCMSPPRPPPTTADRYGWLGLRFAYPQRTWPCGGGEVLGVVLMCQSWPETFGVGDPPQPTSPLAASFGGELLLRGISLTPHGGAFRPGGTIPLTLYWQALAPPRHDYRFFLHLCRDCTQPPLANDDGPPLQGYGDAGRTSTWRAADPVHDERAIELPAFPTTDGSRLSMKSSMAPSSLVSGVRM